MLERVGDIRVVGQASNASDVITLAQALHSDVVLMDISMPAPNGSAATEALRATVPKCAIVLLSLYDDASIRRQAHASGGAFLVGKLEGVEILLAAMRKAGEKGRVSA